MPSASPALVVTIDGPAASGKSTVARRLAQTLGVRYVDTGALYRALTLKTLRAGISPDAEEAIVRLATKTTLECEPGPDGAVRIRLDGKDVTQAIRAPEVTRAVSLVAQHPQVRTWMMQCQRSYARHGGLVIEGRDLGTVVFPDATRKFYLDAPLVIRAQRRLRDLLAQREQVTLEAVEAELKRRDEQDRTRPVAPLTRPPDAMVIDSGALTIEETVRRMAEAIRPGRSRG